MRAQGIQIKTIVWSLFCQIFLLAGMGIALALLAIGGVVLVLPATFFFLPKLDSLLCPKFGNLLDGPSRWCHFTSTLAKGGPDYYDCRVIRRIV